MICLIRHAKTRGNTERRYIGRTDEAICETESLNRSYPRADIVVTSGGYLSQYRDDKRRTAQRM